MTSSSSSTKEGMDMSVNRRRVSGPKAGSVWESRMKLDEVKGGFKVFTPTSDNSEETNVPTTPPNASTPFSVSKNGVEDKKNNTSIMRTKQSPIGLSGKRKTWKSDGSDGSPVQIARQRSNVEEQGKELSVSGDGVRKSPLQMKKTRSVDGNEKGNGAQLRRVKSESEKERDSESEKMESETIGGDSKNDSSLSLQLVESSKSSAARKIVLTDDSNKDAHGGMKKSRSDEDCKEVGVCEEKAANDVGLIKPSSDEDEEDEDEVEDKEIEVEKVNVKEQKPVEIEVEDKKFLQSNEKTIPISPISRKQAPIPPVNHIKIHPIPTKTKPASDHFHGTPRTHSKLQSFVDLIMWRDVSRSAFVFGIGTFVIISSSYSKDLSISFISVISYLGLVYLAAIFLFRSLTNRGSIEMGRRDQDYVVGEEEAIWLIKLVLPYINEFLLKLRALFSGDPATTMKLAVLLFILARCGSSITIWKMAKLGFFGVFIVPKVYSSYASHLTAYGTFWIHRFGDAWKSCSHKKAVGFAIFTLIWNLSSVVARIWAVFMLFVGFKYYQQSMLRDGLVQQEATSNGEGQRINFGRQKSAGRTSSLTDIKKLKKVC